MENKKAIVHYENSVTQPRYALREQLKEGYNDQKKFLVTNALESIDAPDYVPTGSLQAEDDCEHVTYIKNSIKVR